jgi:hypothetical protein
VGLRSRVVALTKGEKGESVEPETDCIEDSLVRLCWAELSIRRGTMHLRIDLLVSPILPK